MDPIFQAFGVPVTVEWPAPDVRRLTTVGVWVPEFTQDAPVGGVYVRREARRVLALRRDVVATVPQRTLVLAPDMAGDDPKGWRVESVEHVDAEHHRVVVVRDDSALALSA